MLLLGRIQSRMLRTFGVLFVIGLIIQITTSVTWTSFSNYDLGAAYFMVGQAVGELCYMFCLREMFKKHGVFLAVAEYAISLIIIDIFTIIFLNPFEISLPKFAGFVVAGIVLILRLNKYGRTAGDTKQGYKD